MKKDLPTLIYEAKQAVFEACGSYPTILDLPFNLYYQLVYTLRELYDFKELNLDSWEGMKINLSWQYSDSFFVRQESYHGDGSYENPIFYPNE